MLQREEDRAEQCGHEVNRDDIVQIQETVATFESDLTTTITAIIPASKNDAKIEKLFRNKKFNWTIAIYTQNQTNIYQSMRRLDSLIKC
jgi:hypothetical protein